MLKSCRTLSMTVRGPALDPRCRAHPVWQSSGRPNSCSWMDRQGRPASPPPQHPPRDSRYGPRTRKVELCIEPGQSLGLMIRGGLEYGLGIYVTGVDKDSVADRAGLLVRIFLFLFFFSNLFLSFVVITFSSRNRSRDRARTNCDEQTTYLQRDNFSSR